MKLYYDGQIVTLSGQSPVVFVGTSSFAWEKHTHTFGGNFVLWVALVTWAVVLVSLDGVIYISPKRDRR